VKFDTRLPSKPYLSQNPNDLKTFSVFSFTTGDEVYHYHTKLVLKDGHGGGAFNWHQDYGYWYKNGCLTPDMATAWVPLDNVDSNNGCLKVTFEREIIYKGTTYVDQFLRSRWIYIILLYQ